jgi:hypothetical protein
MSTPFVADPSETIIVPTSPGSNPLALPPTSLTTDTTAGRLDPFSTSKRNVS